MSTDPHSHLIADAVVSLTGVLYFAAWSISFYPQILLNYRRKSTVGLSPDFVYLNPIGFIALTIWSWAAFFSPIARDQYRERHNGHLPEVSKSDLAFSLHATIISLITLAQVWYYAPSRRVGKSGTSAESRPLLRSENGLMDHMIAVSPIKPSKPVQLGIYIIFIASLVSAIMVWAGRTILLDWLYFISSIKLVISFAKYVPQVILNWRLKSSEGFAIGQILLDLTGSILSFLQLVVSSVYISHDPSGITANPVKLGLSMFSMLFDLVFIIQRYWFFRGRSISGSNHDDEAEGDEA